GDHAGRGHLVPRPGQLRPAAARRPLLGRARPHLPDHRDRPAARDPVRPAHGAAVPGAPARAAGVHRAVDHPHGDLADRRRLHLAADVRQPLRAGEPDPRLDLGGARDHPVDAAPGVGLPGDPDLRDLAVDAVHVPDLPRGTVQRRPLADRGGADRRRRLLDHLRAHRAADHQAGAVHRPSDPRPRSGPSVRRRLGAHARRPRHAHRDHLDLRLRAGLPAVRHQLHRGYGVRAHRHPDRPRVRPVAPHGAGAMRAAAPLATYRKGYVGGAWWQRPSTRSLIWRYLLAIALTVFFLFPVYWLFAVSLKTPQEIFASPPVWVPANLQFGNFAVL